jgi:hypothetical protein
LRLIPNEREKTADREGEVGLLFMAALRSIDPELIRAAVAFTTPNLQGSPPFGRDLQSREAGRLRILTGERKLNASLLALREQ